MRIRHDDTAPERQAHKRGPRHDWRPFLERSGPHGINTKLRYGCVRCGARTESEPGRKDRPQYHNVPPCAADSTKGK